MSELDILVEKAKTDESIMNNLIIKYESFILKSASSVARNYISKFDDEYSVALHAFTEAIKNYSINKGSFLNFAELVIRRRLIDYIRSKSRYAPEITINPSVFSAEKQDDEESYSDEGFYSIEVIKKISVNEDNSLKLEIELANEVFNSYGFSFYDLTECSPKASKTKKSCAKAIVYMIENSILVSNMKVKKILPINVIEKNTKVHRKLLERHRKYIIAAVEIISGDYPYLAEYLRYIRED